MKSGSLQEKKNRKGFYSAGFRTAVNVLLVSVILNFMLVAATHNQIARRMDPPFYATDGIAAPILLTPLSGPNESSEALLPDDPPEEMGVRELPDNV